MGRRLFADGEAHATSSIGAGGWCFAIVVLFPPRLSLWLGVARKVRGLLCDC